MTEETTDTTDKTSPLPDGSMASRLRTGLFLSLGFLLMVPIGAYLTEKVKEAVAASQGYKAHYRNGLGRSQYYSTEIDKDFNDYRHSDRYDSLKYRSSPEWKALMKRHNHGLGIIHLSGRLFTLLVSFFGLLVYFSRRRSGKTFTSTDWIFILFGLFFMRDVVIDGFSVFFDFYTCDEITLWTQYGLPFRLFTAVYFSMGLALFLFILYKIPKRYLLIFLVCGFIGTSAGAYLWLAKVGKTTCRSYES